MVVKLLRKNKKTTDIIVIEQDSNLLRKKEGKLGKPFSFTSTTNCGNTEKAKIEFENLIRQFQEKGYEIFKGNLEIIDYEVFDKVKWHLNDSFPDELDSYQAYVPTGFYLGWLIKKGLISSEFKQNSQADIKKFMDNEITSVKLYEQQLDGVFSSNELNDVGFKFTSHYFDFEKGQYLKDFENTLASNLTSMFGVKDTWENFLKICKIIDERFEFFLKEY